MHKALAAALIAFALLSPAYARTHSHASSYHAPRASHAHQVHRSGSSYTRASGVARDSHGRIKRSGRARSEFQHSHPCPSTSRSSGGCPGYVIDHTLALKHGGRDAPDNMQWQTKQAAKEKDRIE